MTQKAKSEKNKDGDAASTKTTKNRTIYDIIDVFMRVSGDLNSLKDYLSGKTVHRWSSADDQALC